MSQRRKNGVNKSIFPSIENKRIATILSDMDNELQALTQKLEKGLRPEYFGHDAATADQQKFACRWRWGA